MSVDADQQKTELDLGIDGHNGHLFLPACSALEPPAQIPSIGKFKRHSRSKCPLDDTVAEGTPIGLRAPFSGAHSECLGLVATLVRAYFRFGV